MSKPIRILLFAFKALNYWLLVIPARLSFLAFLAYNLLIYLIFGEIDINTIREDLGGRGSTMYLLFMIFFGIPYFISFFSALSMDTSDTGSKVNARLDRAIEYRNGQILITTPNKAFRIRKQTSHLDTMKAHEHIEPGKKVIRGFEAEMRNAPS